ncbi:unnamed protein product, partial [Protopolystoma xenopodis]
PGEKVPCIPIGQLQEVATVSSNNYNTGRGGARFKRRRDVKLRLDLNFPTLASVVDVGESEGYLASNQKPQSLKSSTPLPDVTKTPETQRSRRLAARLAAVQARTEPVGVCVRDVRSVPSPIQVGAEGVGLIPTSNSTPSSDPQTPDPIQESYEQAELTELASIDIPSPTIAIGNIISKTYFADVKNSPSPSFVSTVNMQDISSVEAHLKPEPLPALSFHQHPIKCEGSESETDPKSSADTEEEAAARKLDETEGLLVQAATKTTQDSEHMDLDSLPIVDE